MKLFSETPLGNGQSNLVGKTDVSVLGSWKEHRRRLAYLSYRLLSISAMAFYVNPESFTLTRKTGSSNTTLKVCILPLE